MKRILSLLCALMLLTASPALADDRGLDHCFAQALSLHSLMLEKTTMASLYGAGTMAEIMNIASALDGAVQSVQVLQYDRQGALERYLQSEEGSELPAMSAQLLASYEASISSTLLTQLISQTGDFSLVASSVLSASSVSLAPEITQDTLVVLDFGAGHQLVCIFVPLQDGIVSASASPVPASIDVIGFFCEFFALSPDDVQHYTGDMLYRKSASEALKEYAVSLKSSLLDYAAQLPMGPVREEILAYVEEAALVLHRPATLTRARMLPLDGSLLPAASPEALNALFSSLVTTYNASITHTTLTHALSYFSVSDCFPLPRSMPAAAIVQLDYQVILDEDDVGAYAVVCVFTPTEQGSVLGTAHLTVYYANDVFLDALINGSLDFIFDPALIINLMP